VGLVFSHWTWLPTLRRQFARVGSEFFNSGKQAVIRLITPLRMSYEESYAKANQWLEELSLNRPLRPSLIGLNSLSYFHSGISRPSQQFLRLAESLLPS